MTWRAKPNGCWRTDHLMNRRTFLQASLLGGGSAFTSAAFAPSSPKPVPVKPFELEEATIRDLQAGMKSGKYTARSITEKYLARINEIDKRGPAINAIIEINPDALAIAEALDKERRAKGARGPLHGIPVLIKDNIDTADRMMTTAGSLALDGSHRAAGRLRRAETTRGRRGDSRQDQPERVGQLPLQPFHQRLERPRRPDAQSLRARSQSLRLEFRIGRRRRRQSLRRRRRHRDRRLDHLSRRRSMASSASSRRSASSAARASSRSRTRRTPPDRWRAP